MGDPPARPGTAAFLDHEQYTSEAIAAYEAVYGEDFVSPGGADTARELIARLSLAPGARVLDVGCGLGGSAFLMAREFALRVDGIDLSRNMLAMARRRLVAHGLEHSVNLEHGDVLALDPAARYEAVYSRDVFLHIREKAVLFRTLRAALRPGGRLLLTDYACGEKPWTEAFTKYVEGRAYCLHTLAEYVAIVEAAGFRAIAGHDWSDRFATILSAELARIDEAPIGEEARDKMRRAWRDKLTRVRSGDHRWLLVEAAAA